MTENASQPLKNQLCLHVVNLVRKVPDEPSASLPTFPDPEKVFPISHNEAFSGESDKIKLGMQLSQMLSKLFKKVTDETELLPRKLENKVVTMANFEDYLAYCINLVNSNPSCPRKPSCSPVTRRPTSNGVEKPITTSAPSTRFEEKLTEKPSKSGNRKSKTASAAEEVPPPKSAPSPPPPAEKQPDRKKKEDKENTSSSKKPNDVKAKTTLKDSHDPAKPPQEVTLNWPIIERNLHQRLGIWIETKLKRENAGEIKKSFEALLHEIIKDQIKEFKLKPKDSEELFKKIAGNERSLKFQQVFLLVDQAINNFCSRVDSMFGIIAVRSPQHLRKNMHTIFNDVVIEVERPNVRDMIEKGCNKMIPYYEAINERRIQAEKNISQECSHQIRNFYKEEMERILEEEKYYHPVILKRIHETLASNLERVYQDSFKSSAEERASLKRNLANDYDEISNKNLGNIEKCSKNVKDLVAKLKSEYEVKMDTFLQDHPEGVQLERFNQEQDQFQRAQIAEFRRKIVTLVKEGERVEQHVNTLIMYMDKSRGYFEEENQDNLQETEKKKVSKGKKGKKNSSKIKIR